MEQHEFKEVYDRHARMVFNLCLNHLRNRDEASEATQDVFVKVYDKLDGFKGDAALSTWIHRITINTCLDRIKAAKRKKRSFLGLSFSIGEAGVPEMPVFDHPGVQLERKEEMQLLFAALDRLPTAQRTALLLKTTEGRSMEEIAAVMEISTKAVESLLSRARAGLKDFRERTKD
ncbi:MAG TPA: RNA polymerase sigma factor [Flavobacteriales bacterium]|nr:RNA polymerase sigma factor [Flavobacteriales bacterium]